MGSLGQYKGEYSYVQDVVIENVWMLNGQHGARIKTWAGPDVGEDTSSACVGVGTGPLCEPNKDNTQSCSWPA